MNRAAYRLAALALTTFPVSVRGQQESIVTDRPDQTESAATVAPGLIQVEAGLSLSHDADSTRQRRLLAVPSTLVRLGLLDRLEARLGFAGWQRVEQRVGSSAVTEQGIADFDVGFKLRLTQERGGRPQLAVIATTTLPTGQTGFSSERFDPTLLLAASNTLGERVSVGYNVGVEWSTMEVGTMAGERPVLETAMHALATVAFGLALAKRVGVFAEAFGEVDFHDGGSNSVTLDGGVTVLIRANLQLDLSAGLGLNDAADEWFFGSGIAIRLPR